MYDSIKMGEYLAAYAVKKGVDMNQTKLQKLLYILYGAYLKQYGELLFREQPKAWPYGPVFPRVQKRFAKICNVAYANIDGPDYDDINKDMRVQPLLEAVLSAFGNWSAQALSDWSHQPGSPWAMALQANNMTYNAVISSESIKRYFSRIGFPNDGKTSDCSEDAIDFLSTCAGSDFNPDDDDLGKQKTKRYGQDTRHRGRLITWVMIIIPVWLIGVLGIVAFTSSEKVTDTVKTTLLVTTTANVIGLALVVLRGLFNEHESE